MRGTVFANPDRVMGEDVDDWEFHQGAQAERSTHVINEDEKSRAKGPDFYQAKPVQYCAHGVFADAKVKIASGKIFRREIASALLRDTGFRGGPEVCGSPDQPGNVLSGCVQHLGRRLASRQALRIGREFRKVVVPAFWKLPVLHPI